MRRASLLVRFVWLATMLASCSGSRSERVGSACLPTGDDCPPGTSCEEGFCTEQETVQTTLSATARPEGANAAIEWIAEDGATCMQSETTTCTVPPGSRLTLRAPNVEGFRFAGWSGEGGCEAATPELTLVVQENIACVARYVARVRVSGRVGEDEGSVIARSESAHARCEGGSCEVDRGASVTLVAPMRDGARLTGWSGEGCEQGRREGYALTLTAERSLRCEASFVASLTVRGEAEGAVAVIRASSGAPDATCAEQLCAVDPGSAVELTAPAVPGYRFVGWSGHGSCTGSSESVTVGDVRASLTCKASYVRRVTVQAESRGAEPTPTASALSSDAFAECAGARCVIDEGGTVTLVAATVPGYRLRGFVGEGCSSERSGVSTTLRDVRVDRTCSADYVRGVAVSGAALGVDADVVASSTAASAQCGDGSCAIDAGSSVTLTAPMLPDRTFLGWSGDEGCRGSALSLTLVDVARSTSCVARYALRFDIRGTSSAASLGAVVASSAAPSARCEATSCVVDEGASVTLTARASTAARFVGWDGGGACRGSEARLVLEDARANLSCRAVFIARVALDSAVEPDGSGSTRASSVSALSSCDGGRCEVDAGADVSVLAIAAMGYRFVGWSGCAEGMVNPLIVTVRAATRCLARMERMRFVVSASAGEGGSVSASSGGVPCPGASCGVDYGGSVSLLAIPSSGYAFTGWSCGGTASERVISNVSESQSCSASFARLRYTVVASAGGGGNVSVEAGSGASCSGVSCTVEHGGSVTLEATPDRHHAFSGWSCAAGGATLVLSELVGDRACQATFTRTSYAVSATAGAGGSIRTTSGVDAACSGSSCSVLGGGAVTFTAVASNNYAFSGWTCTVGTPASSASASLAFADVSEAHSCSASFRQVRFQVTVEVAEGLTVTGSGTGVVCSGNVCEVDEGASLTLVAATRAGATRIFTGFRGCAPLSGWSAEPGRADLAFRSTLANVRTNQRCISSSAELAIVYAYQQGYTAPRESIDLPHVCTYGAFGPRESSGVTICRVPVTARVVLTSVPPAGRSFSYWECWEQTATEFNLNNTDFTEDPLTVTGLTPGMERVCQAHWLSQLQ